MLLEYLFWRVPGPEGRKGQYPLPWHSPRPVFLVAQTETSTRGTPLLLSEAWLGFGGGVPASPQGASLAWASVPDQDGQAGG